MPKNIVDDDNSICSSDDDVINNVDLQNFLKIPQERHYQITNQKKPFHVSRL
jgi:hypothetical protein